MGQRHGKQQKSYILLLTRAYILNITWPEKMTDCRKKKKTRPPSHKTSTEGSGVRLATLRKPATNVTRQALEWNPQGKKEGWMCKTDLAQKCRGEDKGFWLDMGSAEEDSPKPSVLKGYCCGPMLPEEQKGISKVSKDQLQATTSSFT